MKGHLFLGAGVLLGIMAVFSPVSLRALDFSVRAKPFMTIPWEDTADYFTIGGGGDLALDFDISSVLPNPLNIGYTLGPEVGFKAAPLYEAGDLTTFMDGGANVSLFYLPFSRWNLRAEAAMGFYQAAYNEATYVNTFWRYGLEGGFRISPMFIVNLNGGYRQYNYQPNDPQWAGFYAGLTVQVTFTVGGKDDGVGSRLKQSEPIFPIFSALYRTNEIGTLTITNHETAEIRNVTVSFRAGGYTSSTQLCGTLKQIRKGGSATVPLYADLSPAIFNFAENSRFPGEVVIEYQMLGSKRTVTTETVVEVYNRNSFRWTDPTALAVFVSPTSPEVLDYQKFVAGFARNYLRTGLNRNMQFAIFLYEGLKAMGLQESGDKQTPYLTSHLDPGKIDEIQFPFQTLEYKSGDMDDLGLLYSACLEAAGISSAIIPLENDFVVAFNLGIDQKTAENYFNSMDNLLVIGDNIWLPVAFSTFKEGFINSWYAAVNAINYTLSAGHDINFMSMAEAWASYPPAAIAEDEGTVKKPEQEAVARLFENDMQRYIVAEFGPKIQAVFADIQQNGPSTTRYNRLGLLYVRSGMFNEAKQVYQRSAALGSVAAMVNLGNIAMTEKDLDTAEAWYRDALAADPDNRTAANALSQINLTRKGTAE